MMATCDYWSLRPLFFFAGVVVALPGLDNSLGFDSGGD